MAEELPSFLKEKRRCAAVRGPKQDFMTNMEGNFADFLVLLNGLKNQPIYIIHAYPGSPTAIFHR